MEFKLIKKGVITDEAIIAEIKRVIKLLDKPYITMRDLDTYGSINSSTVIHHFGSWNNALNLIGVKSGNTFHSYDDLMNNIRDAWIKKGTQPTKRDMNNKELSSISEGAYLRKFGSWYAALDSFITYIKKDEDISSTVSTTSIEEQGFIKHKTKREPSNRLKVQVLMRDGNRCRICGAECSGGLHNIHFDHIKPWSKGGETILENLQVLCSSCNEAKGNI